MHCRQFAPAPTNRRDMLLRCANGFGAMALSALLREPAFGAVVGDRTNKTNRTAGAGESSAERSQGVGPLSARSGHFPAKVRSVIFLYMDGGPSQVDTFDPKPRLDREHGQPIKVKTHPTQFNNVGNVLASPWKFRTYGASGIPVSDLFPQSPSGSMSWRSSARSSRTSLSIRMRITFCIPEADFKAGPAMGPGSPMDWAASVRTSLVSSFSTAA